jgi:hypothetical protein
MWKKGFIITMGFLFSAPLCVDTTRLSNEIGIMTILSMLQTNQNISLERG